MEDQGNANNWTYPLFPPPFSLPYPLFPPNDQGWTLDSLGNFSATVTGGATQARVTNDANEITTLTGSAWTPTYDRAGNMISGPKPGAETTRLHYVYDAWNRLVGVYQNDGATLVIRNEYDGLNRRIEKINKIDKDGENENKWGHDYYYNQNWQIVEDRYGSTNGGTVYVEQYVWGPGYIDSPIVSLHDGGNGTDPGETPDGAVDDSYPDDWRRYYLTDANHNVTTTIRFDKDNRVANVDPVTRYVYTPYGSVTEYGADWTGNSAEVGFDGPRYCGYFSDVETGLYQVRNRYYDPGLSTWISRDPVGYNAGSNLYAYCGSGPIDATDPSGLFRKLTSSEQKDVEHRAAEALKAIVESGTITKEEALLRKSLVHAALRHKMGFDAKQPPNPKYYEYKGGSYCLRPGMVATGVFSRVYGYPSEYSMTGCRRAVQTLMLEALSQTTKSLGDYKAKAQAFDDAIAGKDLDDLFPIWRSNDYQEFNWDSAGLDPETLIPGDRVRMPNHMFVDADGTGNEGSNVIYLGKQSDGQHLFMHMDGNYVDTFDELRKTVQAYSSVHDPNLANYKITERYQPKLPPYLQQK